MGNESSAELFRFSPAAAGGQAGKPQSSAQTLTPNSFPARERLLLHHMLKLHVGREKIDLYFHPKPVLEAGGEAHHADSEKAAASPGCLFDRNILSGNKAGLHSASLKKRRRGGAEPAGPTQNPIPKPPLAAASPSLPGLSQPTWGYPRHPWRSAKIPGCQQGCGNALLCLPRCRDRDIWQLPAGKVSGELWEHESELPALPDVSLLLIYSARQIFALRRPTLSRRGFVGFFFFCWQ